MSVHGNITNVQMARLGISQAQLSAYCGVNINKISPWLAATRDLPNIDLEKIISTIEDLFRLEAAAEPWPIDFRNVPKVKALLERLNAGEFDQKITTAVYTKILSIARIDENLRATAAQQNKTKRKKTAPKRQK